MSDKFIRFFSKKQIFNKSDAIQFPSDLFSDYKTKTNQLSIFKLDEKLLGRVCAHFCLMKKGFNSPEKLSYIIFEKSMFLQTLYNYGLRINSYPDQITCGDLYIKDLHYNIDNLTTENMHNLFLFLNSCSSESFSICEVKNHIRKSIINNYLTFSSEPIKFPEVSNDDKISTFKSYIKDYFPDINSPTYK